MSARTPVKVLYDILSNRGLVPLFQEYKSNRHKLKVQCPKHGIFYTSGFLLKRGNGCSKCGKETTARKRRGSIDRVAKRAEDLGVKLLDAEFPNIFGPQKLRFECPTHGIFIQDHRQLMYGRGCSKCGHIRGGNANRKTTEEFQTDIDHTGYKVLTPYISSCDKITVQCSKHGPFEMIPSDLLGGHGCQKCGLSYSKTQSDIFNFVKSFYPDAVENTRKIIKPLELDIYIPSINLAIEFCGFRWHNFDALKLGHPKFTRTEIIEYHKHKMDMCNALDIRLITIFEDEWMNRKNQVQNLLLSVFNKNQIRIGARKTSLREVSKEEAKNFLDKNHIQGNSHKIIAFGLFYEDNMVAVITGNKHHRQGHQQSLILNRLAFSHNTTVYGGASKLLAALVNYAKNNNYKKIISWSDNRYSEGNVYRNIGFTLTQNLPPDYFYVKGKYKKFSKQSCQKRALAKKGASGSTEKEMAKSMGLSEVWDCGKKRWEIVL